MALTISTKKSIELEHAQFVSKLETTQYNGKQFYWIPGDGGIIAAEDKEMFLYVVHGIPPLELRNKEILAKYGSARPFPFIAETDN